MADEKLDYPRFGITVQEDEQGNAFAGLQVTTILTLHQFYLCNDKNFRQVAQMFNDNILKAGQDMLRHKSGIVTVKGLPDGLVSPKERRRK